MNQLERFTNFLRALNKSEDTISRYSTTIREFLSVVGEKETYTKEDVMTFLGHLQSKKKKHGTGKRMKGAYLRFSWYAVKTFYRCLAVPWEYQREETPKLDAPNRPYYTMEEMTRLIKAMEGNDRNWLIFRIISLSMARRKSITLVKREDYDPRIGTLKMPSVKRGRTPIIDLDSETKTVMDRYLASRTDDYPALLTSPKTRNEDGFMTVGWLNQLLDYYCKIASIECKGMHAWRRGMVTYLYEKGLREREIFEMGDWRTEAMVFQYVQLSPTYAREARKEHHPFFKKDEGN